jgi:hypothetical protein
MTEQQMEKTPREQLADARAELTELQNLIDGLEEKVRDGDETDTAMKLGEAYGLRRLAQLRQEAAERKAARAEEQRRLQEKQERKPRPPRSCCGIPRLRWRSCTGGRSRRRTR